MFSIGQTNKQTAGAQWSEGWFLDPPFGHLAPAGKDQLVKNIKSLTAVEVKTHSSYLKIWPSGQVLKCEKITFQKKCVKKQ